MCSFAYQQQRRVDVDVLKHNELFLRSDGEQPWTVQFGFHPVPHAAMLPFEGSGQSPGRTRQRGHGVRGGEVRVVRGRARDPGALEL